MLSVANARRNSANRNSAEKIRRFLQNREKITDGLKELGIKYVTLDLEGFRSGSMDI